MGEVVPKLAATTDIEICAALDAVLAHPAAQILSFTISAG